MREMKKVCFLCGMILLLVTGCGSYEPYPDNTVASLETLEENSLEQNIIETDTISTIISDEEGKAEKIILVTEEVTEPTKELDLNHIETWADILNAQGKMQVDVNEDSIDDIFFRLQSIAV